MKPSRALLTLLACQTVMVTGLAISFPFLALYLHETRGLPMSQVGVIFAGTLALSALAQAAGGELSDLRGPKYVMCAALALRGLFAAAIAWSIGNARPIHELIALVAASSFFGNFFEPGARSWIAHRMPAADRLAAYGWQRVAVNAGWAVGPAVGGALAERSYPMLFAATAAFCLLCLALTAAFVEPARSPRAAESFSPAAMLAGFRDRRLAEHCLYSMLIAAVMGQLVVSFSVHCFEFVGLSKGQVGLLFTVNGLVVIACQTWAAERMRAHRLSRVIAFGCLFYAAGYAAVGFAGGFFAMAAAVIVVTAGEIIVSPGLPALAMNLAPEAQRGRYIGLQGLCYQAGTALAPLLGGLALERLSPRWSSAPWLLVSAAALAACAGFLHLGRLLKAGEDGLHGPLPPAALEPPIGA